MKTYKLVCTHCGELAFEDVIASAEDAPATCDACGVAGDAVLPSKFAAVSGPCSVTCAHDGREAA